MKAKEKAVAITEALDTLIILRIKQAVSVYDGDAENAAINAEDATKARQLLIDTWEFLIK